MRYLRAPRTALILSGVVAAAVLLLRWGTEGVDVGWLLRVVGVGVSAALLAHGLSMRQRVIDEPVADLILAEREARLHREMNSSH